MKLKTLKDLDNLLVRDEETVIQAYERALRQEAIRDIKNIKQQLATKDSYCVTVKIGDFECNSIDYEAFEPEAIINYIKWKNNLTEEDLK